MLARTRIRTRCKRLRSVRCTLNERSCRARIGKTEHAPKRLPSAPGRHPYRRAVPARIPPQAGLLRSGFPALPAMPGCGRCERPGPPSGERRAARSTEASDAGRSRSIDRINRLKLEGYGQEERANVAFRLRHNRRRHHSSMALTASSDSSTTCAGAFSIRR